ncbi:BON domain-containing protein [Mucilaginibacter sp. HD30]
MKKIIIGVIAVVLAGCRPSDEEVRADIASKARKDLSFAGLDYTVQNGVVNFTGRCPSQKAFNQVKQAIRNVHIIKSVSYDVKIAPVTLDSLTQVKLQVDSILARYPQVVSEVEQGGVTLRGYVTAAKRASLISDARLQIPGNVKDSVVVILK